MFLHINPTVGTVAITPNYDSTSTAKKQVFPKNFPLEIFRRGGGFPEALPLDSAKGAQPLWKPILFHIRQSVPRF